MIARFLRSRPARKFASNRLAVAGLLVIIVYALMGLAAMVGVVSLDDAEQRIGPNNLPGFWMEPAVQTRLDSAEFYLGLGDAALKQLKAGKSAAGVGVAERSVAPLAASDLKSILDETAELHDEIAESDNPASPELRPKLEKLDALALKIVPMAEGSAGRMYNIRMFLGTDRQGRSIFLRAVFSTFVALKVGIIVGLIAVGVGTLLGAIAGYYGGWVDHAVIWLYSTLSSVPNLVLLALLAYVFASTFRIGITTPPIELDLSQTLWPLYIALGVTYWIGPCRVIRGEVLKLRELEFVQAATAIGFGRLYIVLRHVLPNTIHLMLINFSLLFVAAIKSEVILTFLGLGVKRGASWGIMIDQSRPEVLTGNFWQVGTATVFMFVLVLAFNTVSDALQDAFDPKHVG